MQKILVTGGAGFIGSNFVFHMLDKYPDYRIVCVDKLTYAGNLSTLAPVMDNPNFRFCKIDICDREAIYKLFEEEHPEIHIAIGIVDEDGEETYIENGVNLVSVLKVKKDGRYRVFIENQGTKKAIAGGYYWVETEK